MQHFCELKFNQAEAYGGPLQQYLPCAVQNNKAPRPVLWLQRSWFSLQYLTSTTGKTRGVKMRLYKGGDQLPFSSCFPTAKQCVVKWLQPCRRSQELRVQAHQSSTNALWDVPPLPRGAWSAAGKWYSRYCLSCLAMLLCLEERVTKGYQDRAWDGDKLSRLGFCLTCLGTVSGPTLQESRVLGEMHKCCPAWHSRFQMSLWAMEQHGYTSCTTSGGARSSLRFSTVSMSFAPWLLLPRQDVKPTPLLFALAASCRLTFASALGQTADNFCWDNKQATNLGPTLLSKGQVIPFTFLYLHLSMWESCRAGLCGSWDQTMLSSTALVATCRMYTHQNHWCSMMAPHGWLLSDTCQPAPSH